MRYSSFSIFLNFLLTLVIVVGGAVVYQIGNFDGIDMATLKKNYINKKSLKFSDLSKDEQIKYISKNSIQKKNENSISFEDINFDENSVNSVSELRNAIRDLKNKFLIIQNDNLMLFNEKQKLAKLLEKSKNLLEEQKSKLTAKSLEQINETEQQHYKNISELTAKLNDLQRENIELSQGNNAKVIELKNKITALKKKIQTVKEEESQNIDLRILNEKKKNSTLSQTIALLQKRVKLLQVNIKNINQHAKETTEDKNLQIIALQEKNKKILNDKKLLIEKNTQTIFDIEQKQNVRLKEINAKIAKLQNENDEIKKQKDQEKDKTVHSRDVKILALQDKIQNQTDKIDGLKSKLSALEKIKDSFQSDLNNLKNEKVELKLKVENLHSALENIKKDEQTLKDTLSTKHEKSERKHNENYKILNEQIFKYETTIAKLKKSKKAFTDIENVKMSEIRDAFNELSSDVKKREKQYETDVKKLKYELKKRELFYAKKYKDIKPNKPKKLALIDKIDCQDMPYGKAKATLVCKKKVDKFLSKFNSSYFYQIVPIVDNGGFASLKKLDSRGNIMPKKEIKRLTSLANLGLGKYRAAEGGRLVKEKFKDFAKISYAPNNISIGKKRGFIIRVYK
jgi:chromosome segregation ATPase